MPCAIRLALSNSGSFKNEPQITLKLLTTWEHCRVAGQRAIFWTV